MNATSKASCGDLVVIADARSRKILVTAATGSSAERVSWTDIDWFSMRARVKVSEAGMLLRAEH